jgi:hypothetical protein
MPRGRQPEGEQPLSNAERQARYRQRLQAPQAAPRIRYRRPADRRAALTHQPAAVLAQLNSFETQAQLTPTPSGKLR